MEEENNPIRCPDKITQFELFSEDISDVKAKEPQSELKIKDLNDE